MAGARRGAEPGRATVRDSHADGRRRIADRDRATGGRAGLLALQQSAGNAAVSALLAARPAAKSQTRPRPAVPQARAAARPTPKAPSRSGSQAAGTSQSASQATARAGGASAGASVTMSEPASTTRELSGDQLLQPPTPPSRLAPSADPAFRAVTGRLAQAGAATKAHPPASAKAREAQAAAVAPTGDLDGQAKTAKVDTMNAQPVGGFDKKAFIAAVTAAIEAKSPKNLEEADEYTGSGKAGEVKNQVKGLVGQGAQDQGKDVAAATEAAPDTSTAVAKPVTPMINEQPGTAAVVPGEGAAPKPAAPEQLNLAAGPHQAQSAMAEGGVTEQQLAHSNEPQFTQALTDTQQAAAHSAAAPAAYRAHEKQTLAQGTAAAKAAAVQGVTGMQAAKAGALTGLTGQKEQAKSKDEAKRAEVTAKVQSLYASTETDVKKLLDGIDPKVDKAFEAGEARARTAFESFVGAKMAAYKKERYSGLAGAARWVKDKLLGMPREVDQFYAAGRRLYLQQMDQVISNVADIVGNDLAAAKKRIADGKVQIASYVASLPQDLKAVGAEASERIGDQFAQLEQDVEAKQAAVVDALATKYVEARKGLDERIEQLQSENKGLVDKAIGAIKAVVETIRGLVAMLTNVLAKAVHVVGDIIKNPIAFLGNLIAGVKGGIVRFRDNIASHLRRGLMSWLFGALAAGGVEIPKSFDVQGILRMLASIFGLTWAHIRSRIVRRIGAKAMGAVETGVDIFRRFATEGLGGLWEMLLEKLGNIRDMILEKVKDFVITRIITAGITWLISLLNPAAAFIKACKLIYDVIKFFIDNGERIAKFVNTVVDSVVDIVRGNVGGVVAKIENALAQMVPILIGFLASVLGLGGIGQKIREIIEALRKPVTRALDWVIAKGMKLASPIIRKLSGVAAKAKAKVAAGKAWVKGKVEKGKAWTRDKVAAARARFGMRGRPALNRPPTPDEATSAARAASKDAIKTLGRGASPQNASAILNGVLDRHRRFGVRSLELTLQDDALHVKASVNPTYIWRDGVRITISPIAIREISQADEHNAGGLTSDELKSENSATARGYFLYNGKGHAIEQMVSSESAKYRQHATMSSEGAHAEEQVCNSFEIIYKEIVRKKARGAPREAIPYSIKMGIDVSVSCCPNCAQQIADFVQRMRKDGCAVEAKLRFGSLYHGPSMRNPTKGRVIVPTGSMDDRALRRMFFLDGEIRPVKRGRLWGILNSGMKPRNTSRGLESLPSGPRVGELGLAILSRQGIAVSALRSGDLAESHDGSERADHEELSKALKSRADKLEKVILQIEQEIEGTKAS